MSRKSQQPDGGAKRGKKGRKGKKGARSEVTTVEEIVEPGGPPFGLVVLIALVLTLPSLMAFFDGTLGFRPTVVKFLAALLVSWLLTYLVHAVMAGFGKPAEETVTETTTITTTETTDPFRQAG